MKFFIIITCPYLFFSQINFCLRILKASNPVFPGRWVKWPKNTMLQFHWKKYTYIRNNHGYAECTVFLHEKCYILHNVMCWKKSLCFKLHIYMYFCILYLGYLDIWNVPRYTRVTYIYGFFTNFLIHYKYLKNIHGHSVYLGPSQK